MAPKELVMTVGDAVEEEGGRRSAPSPLAQCLVLTFDQYHQRQALTPLVNTLPISVTI